MSDNIKDIGFAIITEDEKVIEDNALDSLGRSNLTNTEWDVLGMDMMLQESNAYKYLKKMIHDARDEGHDRYGDLTGTAWYDADDPEQVDFVMFRNEDADYPDIDVGISEYDEGISEFGEKVLSDTVKIRFFDIPEEDVEAWEDAQ